MTEQRTYVITVETAGTAVPGPASAPGEYLFQAAVGNTGDYIYYGNDGEEDIAATTGYAVKKDGAPGVAFARSLADFFFDADENGDQVIALRL